MSKSLIPFFIFASVFGAKSQSLSFDELLILMKMEQFDITEKMIIKSWVMTKTLGTWDLYFSSDTSESYSTANLYISFHYFESGENIFSDIPYTLTYIFNDKITYKQITERIDDINWQRTDKGKFVDDGLWKEYFGLNYIVMIEIMPIEEGQTSNTFALTITGKKK